MANLKSSKKRIRQTIKRTAYNRYWRKTMKTAIKKARKAILAGNLEEAKKLVWEAQRIIDKVAVKGVIHKREAARRKSRIMGLLAKALKEAEAQVANSEN